MTPVADSTSQENEAPTRMDVPSGASHLGDRAAAQTAGVSCADETSSARWWIGVLVGGIFSLPIGWILSYAATLPFMLGPFFFALFGLVIGAAIHRVASPRSPYGSGALVLGTTMIVMLVVGETIVLESRDFPGEMAALAAKRTRTLGDRSIEEFTAQATAGVQRYLRDNYAPGGTIGFVRWVVTRGTIDAGEIEGISRKLTARQRGLTWCARVVLSFVFLGFGIGSQTLGLRPRKENVETLRR